MNRRMTLQAGLLVALSTVITAVDASWFRNTEQDATKKYHAGEYNEAASGFTDTYRRGVALYRAGRYTEAGESFASVRREDIKPDALYNLGNTYYKRGDYESAVDAYMDALALRPNDEDTLHNLSLAKKMLEQSLTEEMPEETGEQDPEEERKRRTRRAGTGRVLGGGRTGIRRVLG